MIKGDEMSENPSTEHSLCSKKNLSKYSVGYDSKSFH